MLHFLQIIKGLFADFDTTSNRLGNTVKDKNARLAAVLKGVDRLDFGEFDDSHIDLFGDAYEFLISVVKIFVTTNPLWNPLCFSHD